FSVIVLRLSHIERSISYISQPYVAVTNQKLPLRVAHRRAAVAAAAGLVEHDGTMLRLYDFDQRQSVIGSDNLAHFCRHLTTRLEEAQGVRAVADEQVFGLLIMGKHHFVILAPNARRLIAGERRMRRIRMIAVRPYTAGL